MQCGWSGGQSTHAARAAPAAAHVPLARHSPAGHSPATSLVTPLRSCPLQEPVPGITTHPSPSNLLVRYAAARRPDPPAHSLPSPPPPALAAPTSPLCLAGLRLTAPATRLSSSPPSSPALQDWHYVLEGAPGTDYEGGCYHGVISFPQAYPFRPPSIKMVTPNGRFAVNTKLCLSMTDFHPESWNPMW